jgi:hypothetical protein
MYTLKHTTEKTDWFNSVVPLLRHVGGQESSRHGASAAKHTTDTLKHISDDRRVTRCPSTRSELSTQDPELSTAFGRPNKIRTHSESLRHITGYCLCPVPARSELSTQNSGLSTQDGHSAISTLHSDGMSHPSSRPTPAPIPPKSAC